MRGRKEGETGGQSERERNSAGVINGNAEESSAYLLCKNGPPSLIFQSYWAKVMKINTLIITILKIKIEDSVLIVLIFKCLRYIDHNNPVLLEPLWVSKCFNHRRNKKILKEELLKLFICNTKGTILHDYISRAPWEVLRRVIIPVLEDASSRRKYSRKKHGNVTSSNPRWPHSTSFVFWFFKKGTKFTCGMIVYCISSGLSHQNSQPGTEPIPIAIT